MVKIIFICCFFFLFLSLPGFSSSNDHGKRIRGEYCTIDDNYVLLYKIINWWNDSLPEDDALICGDVLRCRSGGGMKVEYTESTHELNLTGEVDLADLISLFKQCRNCLGPKYLESIWLNERIFYSETSPPEANISQAVNQFHFSNIHPLTAKWLKEMAQDLTVQLEGRIGGLLIMDGRIALHNKGKFLKRCPNSRGDGGASHIRVVLLNRETNEQLVKYQIIEAI